MYALSKRQREPSSIERVGHAQRCIRQVIDARHGALRGNLGRETDMQAACGFAARSFKLLLARQQGLTTILSGRLLNTILAKAIRRAAVRLGRERCPSREPAHERSDAHWGTRREARAEHLRGNAHNDRKQCPG